MAVKQDQKLDNAKVKKKCFIITPIGEDNSDIRRQIDGVIEECIEPVLLDEFEVFVSHKISTLGSINNQILTHIFEDELVIANLTELNPNVMYELAFRHAIQKPVIVIKNKTDSYSLPFDIKDDRTIFYENDIMGTKELKNQLSDFLAEIDYNDVFDNPISRAVGDLKIRKALEVYAKETNEIGFNNYLVQRLDDLERKIDNCDIGFKHDINDVPNFRRKDFTKSEKTDFLKFYRDLIEVYKSINDEPQLTEHLKTEVIRLYNDFKKNSYKYNSEERNVISSVLRRIAEKTDVIMLK